MQRQREENEARVLIKSSTALSQNEIIKWLLDLRTHPSIDQSGFAVTAVAESKVGEQYLYAAGVNVENSEHNRLGMHGEQTALMILQAYTAGVGKFSRIWIMAASKSTIVGSDDPKANIFVTPCGHCRQILHALSTDGSEIYAVSCNGVVSKAYKPTDLLSEAFSEKNLSLSSDLTSSKVALPCKTIPSFDQSFLGDPKRDLSDVIFDNFQLLLPHIIDTAFQTSPISAVMLKLPKNIYVPGVLVQDIAFLTTDAIFAAFAHAVTQFGAENLEIKEIHLYSVKEYKKDQALLTGSEINLLRRYSANHTPVYFYGKHGFQYQRTLKDCAKIEFDRNFSDGKEEEIQSSFVDDMPYQYAETLHLKSLALPAKQATIKPSEASDDLKPY